MPSCDHPLCRIIGAECSLVTGLSRGCQTGPRPVAPFEPDLVDEVSSLLAQLGPSTPAAAGDVDAQRAAATRLAFLFRREARNDRNLLALASEDELEPVLATRLQTLCRKHSR